jgi:hypothetical protein
MHTKLAERTVQSTISLKHRWRSPRSQMKGSAVGLYPLPVEIWEEIFAIATDADTYWAEIKGSWCTISNPFFTAKEEDLLRDPTARNNLGLLRTRHSIILVCKSWYFMGIPFLWSHLQFNEKGPRNVAAMIYSALMRNPTLASYAVRLTIKSAILGRSNRIKPEKIDAVANFVRLLTNIEAISCSLPYATHLYPSVQPGVVMLSDHGIAGFGPRHGPMILDSFWIHCRTLSLTLKGGFGGFVDIMRERHEITFDNLLNFRLEVEYTGVLEWIQQYWKFPILKNLHMVNIAWVNRIQLINRVRGTLEKLHICTSKSSFSANQVVAIMPNLKEIYVVHAYSVHRGLIYYSYESITAPNLQRLVMSWRPNPKRRGGTRTAILPIIAAILSHYPSLKELVILAPKGEWVRSSGEDSRVILLLEDIALWCENVTVEIVTGKHAERLRYAKGSVPMDELDALEYYRSIDTLPDDA